MKNFYEIISQGLKGDDAEITHDTIYCGSTYISILRQEPEDWVIDCRVTPEFLRAVLDWHASTEKEFDESKHLWLGKK